MKSRDNRSGFLLGSPIKPTRVARTLCPRQVRSEFTGTNRRAIVTNERERKLCPQGAYDAPMLRPSIVLSRTCLDARKPKQKRRYFEHYSKVIRAIQVFCAGRPLRHDWADNPKNVASQCQPVGEGDVPPVRQPIRQLNPKKAISPPPAITRRSLNP